MTGGYFTLCTEHCCNPFVSNPSTSLAGRGERGVIYNLVSWPTVGSLGLFDVYRSDSQNVHVSRMEWKSSPSALTRPNKRVSCVRHYTCKYSVVREKLIKYGGVQCDAKVTWQLIFSTLSLCQATFTSPCIYKNNVYSYMYIFNIPLTNRPRIIRDGRILKCFGPKYNILVAAAPQISFFAAGKLTWQAASINAQP
jgi:hypothetical protein